MTPELKAKIENRVQFLNNECKKLEENIHRYNQENLTGAAGILMGNFFAYQREIEFLKSLLA